MSPSEVVCIALALCWLSAMAAALAVHNSNFRRAASNSLPAAGGAVVLEDVRSSVDCARRCQSSPAPPSCSYGYSRKSRQCRLYRDCHVDFYTAAQGFDYFAGCSADSASTTTTTMTSATATTAAAMLTTTTTEGTTSTAAIQSASGSGCNTLYGFDACTGIANAECRNGVCQCLTGYSFNLFFHKCEKTSGGGFYFP